MDLAVGQRWMYKNPDSSVHFIAEVINLSPITCRVAQTFDRIYNVGGEYGWRPNENVKWTYLDGQDKPIL